MKHLGLALSGGGFRASLFHLGVVRFLRDAGILPQVSHITSVSGGSVLGAHLALHWDRYCGSEEEFQSAADELIRFIQMDVRNRIVRRVPLIAVGHTLQRVMLRGSNRRLTRPGLLEQYYEKHLYGDRCLFDLPQSPSLYILATNISEGCICAFSRDGIVMQHRVPGAGRQFENVSAGLATIPMAVAASSAFPGFFPPLQIRGTDIGARPGEFDRYAFTDGGVFDNLGVRMFRLMEKTWGKAASSETKGKKKPFETILVSDAGSEFSVYERGQSGGLIKTALRASDILWDRVGQLEMEHLKGVQGIVLASIRDVVSMEEDATVLHPEMQRQTARLRTDLDRFTDLEVRCLVMHGYCIARQSCKSQPAHFDQDLPDTAPWDPLANRHNESAGSTENLAAARSEGPEMVEEIRTLRKASSRTLFGRLIDFRDWPTYLWLSLIIAALIFVPYQVLEVQERARQSELVLQAIADTSPLYHTILQTLGERPVTRLDGLPYKEVDQMEPQNFEGFEIVTDARVFDLRAMDSPSRLAPNLHQHSSVRIRRTERVSDNTHFRVQRVLSSPKVQIACGPRQLNPVLTRMPLADGKFRWQLDLDFSRVPIGQDVDITTDALLPREAFMVTPTEAQLSFTIPAETGLAKIWILMPSDRSYYGFEIIRTALSNPDDSEVVIPTDKVELPLGSLVTFQLVAPEENFRYECRWTWLDD